jgi:hypothetical protein
MIRWALRLTLIIALSPLVFSSLIGCYQEPTKKDPDKDKVAATDQKKPHVHGDWWCDEHGVTEEECTRCHPKLIAKYKEKGDWCKKHNRPDSQCFICHPEKEKEWAAKYFAKYNKQPPKPEKVD